MRTTILLAILCPALCLAQPLKKQESLTPLTVGDTLPAGIYNPNPQTLAAKPAGAGSYSTKQTPFRFPSPVGEGGRRPDEAGGGRGEAPKLLLLDFWATWCTACLKHFPQLDSLQQRYNGQVQVLLVNSRSTGDNEQRVKAFFQKWKAPNGKPFALPTLVDDTIFAQLFPHSTIPHYVWLDDRRQVLAITGSEELTDANIRTALDRRSVALRTKTDVLNYNAGKPLLVDGNGGTGEVLRFHSLISGYIQGLPTGTRQQKTREGLYTKLTFTNRSVLSLYAIAFGNTFPGNRVILEVPDTTLLTKAAEWGSWKYQNTWCYELVLPPATKEAALARMQQDLVAFFGYTASVENRLLDTWVLQGTSCTAREAQQPPAQNLFGPGPKFITNQSITAFLKELNNLLPQPVCNEATGYPNLTLSLPDDLTNREQLNDRLRPFGLRFTLQKWPWPVFIIRGNPNPLSTQPPPKQKQTGNKNNDE